MIKPRRTKYQWVDSKWVQLFHELCEVREKFVIYIYFRYVSMSATMVEAILNPNTEERPVETGRKSKMIQFSFFQRIYFHHKISPQDSYIVAQLAFTSFYRSPVKLVQCLENIWRVLQTKTRLRYHF